MASGKKPSPPSVSPASTVNLDLTTPAAREARTLMQRCEPEPKHALQVTRLSVRLFDLLTSVHLLKPIDRTLIQCAALLHDTGWSVAPSGKSHHKHSADIIRSHPWRTLDPHEVEIVAQTARYHRKKLPTTDHKPFARLNHPDRQRLCRMAALLRIADALDRSHTANILSLTAHIEHSEIRLRAISRQPAHEEEYGFLKKRDLFVCQFERAITLDVCCRPA